MKNNTDGMTHEEKICWLADNIRAGNKFQLQYIEDGDNWFDWGADGRVNDKYTCRLKPAMERPTLVKAIKDKKPLKMKVTPQESKEIQEVCFENGVYWHMGGKVAKHVNEGFLHIWETYMRYDIVSGNKSLFLSQIEFPEYIPSTDTIISNEPEYVEFDSSDDLLGMKIMSKDCERGKIVSDLIVSQDNGGVGVYDDYYEYPDLFKKYIQIDGTPCGKKNESDILTQCKQCKHYRDLPQPLTEECRKCRYYDEGGVKNNFESEVK